ncbi:MAG: cupin domain-containing protein, partial [Phycisphaerales bacterium]|nr:cupin domain-containing protein [Phycisphaerales bacterium]
MNEQGQESSVAEHAALYLSGAMSDSERQAFEAELTAGRPDAVAEVRRLQLAVEGLAGAAPSATPDPGLRAELLQRISAETDRLLDDSRAAQVWRGWRSDDAADPLFTLYARDGQWEDTGVEGVHVRRLFVDRAANRMTAMFRMAPGASYPEHLHDGPEECYVLEGDLHVGDRIHMHQG